MATQQQWKDEGDIDFDSIPDHFEPARPSIYEGLIVSATRSPTKEGRPQVSLDIDLEQDMVSGDKADGSIRYSRVLIVGGKTGFRLKQLCKSTEVESPKNGSTEEVDEFCNRLVGARVYLRSKLEPSRKDSAVSFPAVAAFLEHSEAVDQANSAAAAE